MTTEQKCYLAGFIDGEGMIALHSNRTNGKIYHKPYVSIKNTNGDVLRLIQEWLRTEKIKASIGLEKRGHIVNAKDCFILRVYGLENIRKFLVVVSPFLYVKLAQAKLLYEYCCSRLSSWEGKNGKRCSYTNRQDEIARTFQSINAVGRN